MNVFEVDTCVTRLVNGKSLLKSCVIDILSGMVLDSWFK